MSTVAPSRLWALIALGLVVTIATPWTSSAQGGFFATPQPPPIYTPAKDAKDLKSVLFKWTWYMGMLRGVDEHEIIASLEYQGTGTVQIDGQPCKLTKYRVSTKGSEMKRRLIAAFDIGLRQIQMPRGLDQGLTVSDRVRRL